MATGTGKTYQGIDYSETRVYENKSKRSPDPLTNKDYRETRVYENKMERVSEKCPA